MKTLFLMLCLALSMGTFAVGCADEVNAEGDINPDEDDGADEGAAGMGDPEPVDDVDECVAACNDDACAAACED
jgi:hypothetical protein